MLIVALFLIAFAALAFIWFLWPPFDLDFWVEFWIFILTIVPALTLSALHLAHAKRWWAKSLSVIPALLGLAILGGVAWSWLWLRDIGASIELLAVPENPAVPERRLHLAWLQLESTADEPGPPIVYLAGGPGGGGTLTLALSGRYPVFDAMRQIADVIVLDQRGTMPWNDPWLICPNTWSHTLDEPMTGATLLAAQAASLPECLTYFEDDVDLSAWHTDANADDIDALRQALGADRVTLWGTSYGSHLALAYLKKYPDNVHRMILHGIEGLDDTLKLPSDVDAAIDHLTQLADSDLAADIAQVLAGLEAAPVTVALEDEPPVTIGVYDAQLFLALRLRSGSTRSTIPRAVARMLEGDFEQVARFSLNVRQGRRDSLMALAMDCASGASTARIERVSVESATSLLGDVINHPFPDICASVPHTDLGSGFREPLTSAVPALLISGTQDGRTPVSNAERVLQGLPNGQHLIIDGAGHGDELFVSSPDILRAMLAFLRDEPLPATRIKVPFAFDS
ncbi:MAG: alpha/beta hydrolase [Gammaproteobacteria bacterium]|nr:alpha/beta hydrolase [Gammaproteobacteria bacterium]